MITIKIELLGDGDVAVTLAISGCADVATAKGRIVAAINSGQLTGSDALIEDVWADDQGVHVDADLFCGNITNESITRALAANGNPITC